MADPTQSHGRGAQKLPSPPILRSPLSSGSGSGTPISFQTNVNRSKTKRWVEAKQYSYDGGDWGSDEYEEEEEEVPPAVSRPPYASRHTGSSSELSLRRLSGIGFGTGASESNLADGKGRSLSGGDQKTLPFARPADRYKRMREEKATQQSPTTDINDPQPEVCEVLPQTNKQSPPLGLPEVKRMSSFGADFLSGTDSSTPKDSSASQEPSLHHNPSSGFRSVVNQAFDVPETPPSTTTTVTRSNSDDTSMISPIMGVRTRTDERAPTILEEPNDESSSLKATGNAIPGFNPGHRRDLSLPSSDNSPSRIPQVTDQETPLAGCAELSSIPLLQNTSPESTNADISPQNPLMQSLSTNGQDMPAPLKFGNASGPDAFRSEIPTIMAAEESPQNTDNDRLREEIIRSLSRETPPMEDPEPSNQSLSQASAESVPHQEIVSGSHPEWTSPPPLPPRDPYATSQGVAGNYSSTIIDQPKKPKLERRFSWESSDSSDPGPPQIPGSYSSPPRLATSSSTQEPEPIHEKATTLASDVSHDPLASEDERSVTQRAVERPRLSIVPPIPENMTPPEQVMGPGTTPPPQQVSLNAGSSSLDESKLLGFRDILGISSINQRIKSFDHTRDQFATIDTGLNHWLQFTVHEHPEHADVVQRSQNLSPTVPPSDASRSRFPKLGALSNLGALNDGTSASTTHIRRPSGHLGTVINKDKVGERGKELFHTAGAFSGKAMGLFAKGRSKFRPSGGSEKVQSTPSVSRRSFQFSFPSGSGEAPGNSSSLRNSVTLASLPAFISKQTGLKPDPDPPVSLCLDHPEDEHNTGKRVEATKSGNNYLSHNPVGETTVPPKQLSSSNGVPLNPEFPGESVFAGDLEQEMIDGLGLSPADPHHRRAASTPTAWNAFSQINGGKQQVAEPLLRPGESLTGNQSDAVGLVNKAAVAKMSLPVIPDEPFQFPFPVSNSQKHQPSKSTPEVVIPSIRPLLDQISNPPSPPPNDYYIGLVPSQSHRYHLSVSSLGVYEQRGNISNEEIDRDPPSPLQETKNELKPEPWDGPKVGHSLNDASSDSQSSAQVKRRSFIPFYSSGLSKLTSSADVLKSEKKLTNGLPPSAPDFHSPLRNEVRYIPETRSSVLGFESFGKQSANGKETGLSTPANVLPQPSESGSPAKNGSSTIGKLKEFRRQRHASVGDLLSGVQLQGPQAPPAGQPKRTFSRISVLFGRQNSQNPARKSTTHTRSASEQLQNKDRPKHTSTTGTSNTSSAAQDEPSIIHNLFEPKHLPTRPPEPKAPPPPPRDTKLLPCDDRQRAGKILPHSSSSNSLATGRFYSHFQSGSTNQIFTGSHHLSHPLLGQSRSLSPMSYSENIAAHPLSLLEESQDNRVHELHEEHTSRVPGECLRHELCGEMPEAKQNHSGQQYELQGDLNQQSLTPQPNTRSRTPLASGSASPSPENHESCNIAVSNASVHPHRSENEARVVNYPPHPVELAITADDSSEEIVMSPTSYPGQEWTPMHL
ncbi:hypothetical protein PDIDSM_1370 [Penicillium digitatum]|nr:hypothetical protein PDIDSM_1370 [Penicillium digitatum]